MRLPVSRYELSIDTAFKGSRSHYGDQYRYKGARNRRYRLKRHHRRSTAFKRAPVFVSTRGLQMNFHPPHLTRRR